MRYSRFKQQMEGNQPIRRIRNPNSKRASKNKRPKDEDNKSTRTIKSEESLSMGEQMQVSSPSVASYEASQESLTPTISEPIIKSEPREDHVSHPVSPEVPLAIPATSYSGPEMPLQTMTLPCQVQQYEADHLGQANCEAVPNFNYDAPHAQAQHQQRMFQAMMPQQVQVMMGQSLSSHLMMTEQPDYEPFLPMDMYGNPMNDMAINGPMMVPLVKVEERWDSSYGQT
jgi:hypothetical protein